jgi:EpsI family protein
MRFLKTPPSLCLSVILAVQAATFYGVSRQETPPPHPKLAGFPAQVNGWVLVQEGVVEKEVQEVLRADDLLSRSYRSRDGRAIANLFVAYFRSQRTGVTPHSPKNCLPGSGWVATVSDIIPVPIPDLTAPIRVNRYIVAKGDARSVVLYWYQSGGKVIASEFEAKIHLVKDAIRYNRTDTALVRVVLPWSQEDQTADRAAIEFVQAIFGSLAPFVAG